MRIQSKYIHLLRAPIIAAVVLAVCGGNISASKLVKKGVYKTVALITIGVSLPIFGFAAMVSILTWFTILRKYAEDRERRLVDAVVASMPILLVRLIYAALIMFYNKGNLYILSDSVVIFSCMALMLEMLVITLYLAIGFTLPKLPREFRKGEGRERLHRRTLKSRATIQ